MEENDSKAEGDCDVAGQAATLNPEAKCNATVHLNGATNDSEEASSSPKDVKSDSCKENAESIIFNGALDSPSDAPDHSPKEADPKAVKRKSKTNNAAIAKDGSSPPKKSKILDKKGEGNDTTKKAKAKKASKVALSNGPLRKTKRPPNKPQGRKTKKEKTPSGVIAESSLQIESENHVSALSPQTSNASLSPPAVVMPVSGDGRTRRTKSPKPGDFARKPRMKSPTKVTEQSASDDDLPLSQLQSNLTSTPDAVDNVIEKEDATVAADTEVDNKMVSATEQTEITKSPPKKKAAKKKSDDASAQESKGASTKKKKKVTKKVESELNTAVDKAILDDEKSNSGKKTVKKKKVKKNSVDDDKGTKNNESRNTLHSPNETVHENGDSIGAEQTAMSPSTESSGDRDTKMLTNSKISNKEGFEADVVSGNKLDSLAKLDSTPVKLLPAVLVKPLPHEENVRKSIDIYDMIDEDFDDLPPMRPSGGHLEKGGTSPRALRLTTKDNSEGGRCEKCGLILPTAAKLTKHTEHCEEGKNIPHEDASSEEKPFKCTVCEYRCKWKFKLRRHQQIHGVFECSHCDLQAKSETELDQHHKMLHPNKPGKKICKTCKTYVVWGEDFDEHVKNCQGKEPLRCPKCNKEFKSRSKLLAHEVIHTKPEKPRPEGAHKCHRCDYNTKERYRLTRHLKAVHGEQLSCSECKEEFGSYLLLMKHAKIHVKPITCPTCGKVFKSVKILHSHQLTHNSSNTFKCSVEDCEKSYKSQKLLRDHFVEAHTNVKRYQCTFDGCKQEFFKQSHLRRHEATHTGERRFKCDWPNCGKAFRHADNLKVHYRQHTNEKPFKCENCDFACRQKSSLQWHLKRYHQVGAENSPKKGGEGSSPKELKTRKKVKVLGKAKKTAMAADKGTETKPKKVKKETKSKASKANPTKVAKSKAKETKGKKAAAKAEKKTKAKEDEEEQQKESVEAREDKEGNTLPIDPIKEKGSEEKDVECAEVVVPSEVDKTNSELQPMETTDQKETQDEEGEVQHDSKVLDSPVSEAEEEQGDEDATLPLRPQKSPTQEEFQSGNEEDSSPMPTMEADVRPHAPRPPSPDDDEEQMPEESCPASDQSTIGNVKEDDENENHNLPDDLDNANDMNSDDENELATTRSLADDDYIAPSAPAPPQPIEDPGITPPPPDVHEESHMQEQEFLPPQESQTQPVPMEHENPDAMQQQHQQHQDAIQQQQQQQQQHQDAIQQQQQQQQQHQQNQQQQVDAVAHSVSSMMSPHMAPKSVPSPPPMYHSERQDAVEKKDAYSPHISNQAPDRRDSYQSTDYAVNTPQSQQPNVENVCTQPPPHTSVETHIDAHVYRDSAPSPSRSVAPMYSTNQDTASGLPPPPPTMSRDSGYSSSMMSTPGQYLQPPLPPASDYPRTMSCMPGLSNRSQDPSLFPPPPPSGNFYSQFLPPDPPSLPPVDDRYTSAATQRPPATLPQEQQPSSFHMLSRPNPDLLRRATDIHKGYGSDFLQAGMHQPIPQSHWISQDDRTRHWTQPSSLPLPPDISSNPTLPKDSFLSVEREYEANRQLNKTTTFPTDPMSHLDMASMYMSRHFNPAAAAAAAAAQSSNYQRQLPTTTNTAKPYEDTYRHSHMPDYRALSAQTGGDMFRSMGMTAGFGLEKYYYPRDSMYRPQHLPSSSNPFIAQTAANQMASYTDRDYARNAAMYHQPSPYSFMGDKQYIDSRKLAQPAMPGLTNRPLGADYFPAAPPPPNATQDPHFQDPYRRSVIYNMMNRYFE